MTDKTGGAVFPTTEANYHNENMRGDGISLRDYFAAKALQGICAHHDTWGLLITDIADRSYEIADAILAERAK